MNKNIKSLLFTLMVFFSAPKEALFADNVIDLHAQSKVGEGILKIKDVAWVSSTDTNFREKIESFRLGLAPEICEFRKISREDIIAVIEIQGLDSRNIRFIGADEVLVRRIQIDESPADEEQIANRIRGGFEYNKELVLSAVRKAIMEKSKELDQEHTSIQYLRQPQGALRDFLQDGVEVKKVVLDSAVCEGEISPYVELWVRGKSAGQIEKRIEKFSFSIQREAQVLVAVRALDKGANIAPEDLTFKYMDISKAGTCVKIMEAAVGKQLKKSLKPGEVLSESALETAKLVLKGSSLRLPSRFIVGGIPAVAMEEGGFGDTIRVQTLGPGGKPTGMFWRVRITGKDTVETLEATEEKEETSPFAENNKTETETEEPAAIENKDELYAKKGNAIYFYDEPGGKWHKGLALTDGKKGDVIDFKTILGGVQIVAQARVVDMGAVVPVKPLELPNIQPVENKITASKGETMVQQGESVGFIDAATGKPGNGVALEAGNEGDLIVVSAGGKSRAARVIGKQKVNLED